MHILVKMTDEGDGADDKGRQGTCARFCRIYSAVFSSIPIDPPFGFHAISAFSEMWGLQYNFFRRLMNLSDAHVVGDAEKEFRYSFFSQKV
jgi:hypothetical protein